MASYLSEDLNEREQVHDGPARLIGYDLTSVGASEERFVAFKDGEHTHLMIVVPAEGKSITGLFEPYPDGLSIESLTGDGTLVANVFYEPRDEIVNEDAEDEVE